MEDYGLKPEECVFIDDREGFEAAWELKEYEHEGCFCIEPQWIESCKGLKEENDS